MTTNDLDPMFILNRHIKKSLLSVWSAYITIILLGTGCATVIKGKSQAVQISSSPSSANVYVNNAPIGSTPVRHRFIHGKRYLVEVRKVGFSPKQTVITSSFSGHSLWLGPWSFLFDLIAGTVTTIDQTQVHLALDGHRPTVSEELFSDPAMAPRQTAQSQTPHAATSRRVQELKVAVVEFGNRAKLTRFEIESVTDMVRGAALEASPHRLFVLTRENIRQLLPPGTVMGDCEGRCEVETGRTIGADFIVTGSVGRFGRQLQVKMRLHETKGARLLSTKVLSAPNIEALEVKIKQGGQEMFSEALYSVTGS